MWTGLASILNPPVGQAGSASELHHKDKARVILSCLCRVENVEVFVPVAKSIFGLISKHRKNKSR